MGYVCLSTGMGIGIVVREWEGIRGVATGVYRYIYPQKSVYLKKICGCSSPVTQNRFDMIYVHVWDINICFEIAMTS